MKYKLLFLATLLILLITPVYAQDNNYSVSYHVHQANIGWEGLFRNGEEAGQTGIACQLEALTISIAPEDGSFVVYRTHIANIGWTNSVENGAVSGTEGQNLALQAFEVSLTGPISEQYDIYYAAHVSNYGWLGWAKNGETAGTVGLNLPVESIRIKLVPIGGAAPGDTANPSITLDQINASASADYTTYLSGTGWQNTVNNDTPSGDPASAQVVQGLRVQIHNNFLSGGIRYQTYCSNVGWTEEATNGSTAGLPGEQQVEAFQIGLYGQNELAYDVYYQAYVSEFGWLGWAMNNQTAGTTGAGLAVQAIKVVLVPKNGVAPGMLGNALLENPIPGAMSRLQNGTGVLVDINVQRLRYFENNELKLSTPIITGQVGSVETDTPRGSFTLLDKQRNVTLRGADYTDFVEYWLPYIGKEYGIHDASWRSPSEFGGNTYLTNGSHGCVNLPVEAAAQLYSMIRIGSPIIIY